MLEIVLAVIALVVVGLLVFAAFKPDSFRIERAIDIQAPPETIYALIADFHKWPLWSPWEAIDPALKRSYSGAPEGVGAIYDYEGPKAGAGHMEITQAVPLHQVSMKLDFIKPFPAHNLVEFNIVVPTAGPTHVNWSMRGPQPYLTRLMTIFFNMEALVGKDFEKGLAALKAEAEKG